MPRVAAAEEMGSLLAPLVAPRAHGLWRARVKLHDRGSAPRLHDRGSTRKLSGSFPEALSAPWAGAERQLVGNGSRDRHHDRVGAPRASDRRRDPNPFTRRRAESGPPPGAIRFADPRDPRSCRSPFRRGRRFLYRLASTGAGSPARVEQAALLSRKPRSCCSAARTAHTAPRPSPTAESGIRRLRSATPGDIGCSGSIPVERLPGGPQWPARSPGSRPRR